MPEIEHATTYLSPIAHRILKFLVSSGPMTPIEVWYAMEKRVTQLQAATYLSNLEMQKFARRLSGSSTRNPSWGATEAGIARAPLKNPVKRRNKSRATASLPPRALFKPK